MEDVTPKLLKEIQTAYNKEVQNSKKIQAFVKKAKSNNVSYKDAYNVANEIGNIRAKVFKNKLSSAVLPDGKMYFNIADRIIKDSLEQDYKLISSSCEIVQKSINAKSKIGLKAQVPKIDNDRVMGFINRISSEANFDDVAWILEEPIKTFERSIVDDVIKKNAEFQNNTGVKASIIRTSDSKCCEWCDNLAGTYDYPGVPNEVFMRHDNCKCSLEYYGKKLNSYYHNFME